MGEGEEQVLYTHIQISEINNLFCVTLIGVAGGAAAAPARVVRVNVIHEGVVRNAVASYVCIAVVIIIRAFTRNLATKVSAAIVLVRL